MPGSLASPDVARVRAGNAALRGRRIPLTSRSALIAFAVVGLVALQAFLSFHALAAKSIWLDEAVSVSYATDGLANLWHVVSSADPNMSLYYAGLDLWARIGGTSAFAVRSLSAVCAVLTVPVVIALGREMFGWAEGLIAGLLISTSAFLLQYAQTARSYTLLVLLVTASTYCFVLELKRPTRLSAVGYVLASSLAFYAQYFAAYVLLVQVLTVLAVERRAALSRRRVAIAGAVAVACAPGLYFVAHAPNQLTWISKPTLADLPAFFVTLSGGVAVLAVVLGVLAIYALVTSARAAPNRGSARWSVPFLAASVLAPVALTFLVSLVRPTFIPRYLIITLPAFMLIAAVGLVRLPRVLAAPLLVAIAGLSAYGVSQWYTAPGSENYRAAVGYVIEHQHPGDGYMAYPVGAADPVAYYIDRAGSARPTAIASVSADGSASAPRRVWLVVRDFDVHLQPALFRSVENSFVAGYIRTSTRRFRGVEDVLYVAR
jgi:mannosyltransferase